MHRRTALGTIATLPLVAGCLGGVRGGSAAESVERIPENERSIAGVSGRVRFERAVDGETTETRLIDVWSDPGGPVRHEVRDDHDGREMTVVADDDETWVYFPEAGGAAPLEFRLEYAGAYPFEYGGVLDNLDAYDVERRGREEVAGRTVDHLDCRAGDAGGLPEVEYYSFRIGPAVVPGGVPDRVELWIDDEYGVPLGRAIHTSDGRSTARFEDVALDRPVPADRLSFDPPPGAEVLEWATGFIDHHGTVEQAEVHAGFEFGAPERVADRELDSVGVVYTDRGTGLQGWYLPDGATVELGDDDYATEGVSVRAWESRVDPDVDGESTTVAGDDAVIEYGDEVQLAFDRDGHTYEIRGPDERAVRRLAAAI